MWLKKRVKVSQGKDLGSDSFSMNAETLLILGAREMQVPAIRTAKEIGVRVIAVDPLQTAPGLSMADRRYVCDLYDFDKIISIAQENAVKGVVTLAADFPIPALAIVAERLNLPAISRQAAFVSTNKAEMRKSLKNAGLVIPRWEVASSPKQAVRIVNEIDSIAIIKPLYYQKSSDLTEHL